MASFKNYIYLIVALAAVINAVATPVQYDPDRIGKRATCTPTAANDASVDDTPAIAASISSCGAGGTIVIPAGTTYNLLSTLSFDGCSACDFQIEGTLLASDDLTIWNGVEAMIELSGITTATVQSVTGSGVIDGNGQAFWDEFAVDSSYARPTLFLIAGSTGITIQNLQFMSAPSAFHSANDDSSDILYSNITLYAVSTSENMAVNTDGWDVGPATHVTITNAVVTNDDDCVAFKAGANFVTVDTISCTGSHGLSVGSLGSQVGVTDTVENIYVTNADMSTSAKATGIKLWPGGFGSAVVNNVTWNAVTINADDYAAQIQSCYSQTAEYCADNPSNATLTDVSFTNFQGTTSAKFAPVIANLDCPPDGTCGVSFSGWSVVPPSGTAEYLCANIDSIPGITCTSGASG